MTVVRYQTSFRGVIGLVTLALMLAMASLVLVSATLIAGLTITEALPLAVVLSVQLVVGVFLWLTIRRGAPPRIVEVLGIGLVLGPLVYTVLGLLAYSLPFRLPSASILGFMAVLGVLLGFVIFAQRPPGERLISSPTRGEIALIAGVVPLSIIFLVSFWAEVPLPRAIRDWGTLSGDAAFHEAIARSITTLGPSNNLLADGHGLRYHWFSHAWAGFVQEMTGAGTFTTTTRLLPMVAVVATILLAWEWIRTLAGSQAPAWLAVAFILLSGTWTLVPGSPPQVWSTALSMALVVVIWRGRWGEVRWLAVIAATISAAMVLSKASAVVLVGALCISALVPLSRGKPHLTRLRVAAACTAFSGLVLGLFTFGYGNSLKFSLTQTLEYLRFLPDSTWRGAIVVGLVLCAISLMFPWIGAANLVFGHAVESRLAIVFGGAVAFGALALALLTGQWGQSQMYFITTANAVLIPLSAWGAYRAFQNMWPMSTLQKGTIVIGVALILLVSFSPWLANNWQRAILVVVASSVAGLLIQISSSDRRLLVWVAGASAVLVVGAFVVMPIRTIQTLWTPVENPQPAGEWTSNSISIEHLDALAYLSSVSNGETLIATNFFCDEPRQLPPDCLSIQFPVAALTGLPTLIEGYSYSVGNGQLPEWAASRVRWSTEFTQTPSKESLDALWDSGVRWVFIDKRRTSSVDWSPYAISKFQNKQAAIVELQDPAKLG